MTRKGGVLRGVFGVEYVSRAFAPGSPSVSVPQTRSSVALPRRRALCAVLSSRLERQSWSGEGHHRAQSTLFVLLYSKSHPSTSNVVPEPVRFRVWMNVQLLSLTPEPRPRGIDRACIEPRIMCQHRAWHQDWHRVWHQGIEAEDILR